MACRVDELRNVGDTWVYEVASLSFVIVRYDPQTITAFYNRCLHLGMHLRDCPGQVSHLKCTYRTEELTYELHSLLSISYAVFGLQKNHNLVVASSTSLNFNIFKTNQH